MNRIAVVYHSAHGHTEFIARKIAEGVAAEGHAAAMLRKAEELIASPGELVLYDGLILGSPTYLGGVSGTFKTLMDATGGLWRNQQLRGKLAAGFTVSSLPSGDKQSTLQSMFTFCMQHGMIWVGNAILPEQQSGIPYDEAANRLGSWTGLMAQAAHRASADAFAPGDSKGARMFGAHFARTVARFSRSIRAPEEVTA
jgi:NAD(P)H dehydrogenase (quinone)